MLYQYMEYIFALLSLAASMPFLTVLRINCHIIPAEDCLADLDFELIVKHVIGAMVWQCIGIT